MADHDPVSLELVPKACLHCTAAPEDRVRGLGQKEGLGGRVGSVGVECFYQL